MPNDVFGRPMDVTPRHANPQHIAPCPWDSPGPQNDPVDTGALNNFSPPGESGAFAQGQHDSESLGARQSIQVKRPLGPGPQDGGMLSKDYNHGMDAKLMPRKMP